MDISETLAPTSDQLDAVDLLGGPRTFTIADVSRGSAEQPVQVKLAEFPRPWRPGKSMRRVMAAAWGVDASVWIGRRLTLYCDTRVTFGGQEVGGIRVSHMSHIKGRQKIPLLVTRGKSKVYTVDPLPDKPEPQQQTGKITKAQQRQLGTLLAERGISRDEALPFAVGIVGHDLASSLDLTEDEAGQVIASLTAKHDEPQQDQTEPEGW